MRPLAAADVALLLSNTARAEEFPIFDAHMHYSHDAWSMLPVDSVLDFALGQCEARWYRVRITPASNAYTPRRPT